MKTTVAALLAAGALVATGTIPVGAAAAASEPNLQPVLEKLQSAATRDRVIAIRDFMRLKPTAAKARPVLQKLALDPSPEVRAETVGAVAELLGAGGVDLLEKLYSDSDRVVRDGAIREACRMWDQARPRALCKTAFKDPEDTARVQVLGALRDNFPRDAQATEIFRKGLADRSEMVQRSAVFGVQAARDGKSVAELGRLARTATDMVAVPAAQEALATIGTPEAVQELIKLVPKPTSGTKPSEAVRIAAVIALDRVKDTKALPALRALLNKNESPSIRVAAINALTSMKDRQAVPLLTQQLKDPEPRVRQSALRGMRQIGDTSIAATVRTVMKDDQDPNVRMSAVNTLADLLKEKSIPDLAGVKEDLSPEVRIEAAADLAGFGKPAASALAGFLKDKSPDVRKTAIQGLGTIGGPEHIPAIAEAAAETGKPNLQVRMMAAEALGNIKHQDAIPALVKLAGDPEPSVRQAAATALGQVGGPKAAKALEPLLKDNVAIVRTAARRAQEQANK